ncbi:OsmC family protein [Rothia uropygialis]|uniref:OsmC family protein n=1 Tax=Kocuria sp. 36 TaxID=1415402 RepID=UPI00101D306C|nr:OsmC family protein [Kocuria sp. 36]
MPDTHSYDVTITWTGNLGPGTDSYTSFNRDHRVESAGLPPIEGSADPAFRGDPDRWNPEQLLVASLSQCHMLWYLHLAASAGVAVIAYRDRAEGVMVMGPDGSGRFERVILNPRVTISMESDPDKALALHGSVGQYCFIARSVNFPVEHKPEIAWD